jgi:hypothetical protein
MATTTSGLMRNHNTFRASIKRIALISTLSFFVTPEHSHAIPPGQINCVDNEITILPSAPPGKPTVIDNAEVTITYNGQSPLIVNDNRCIVTFSTEAATSASRQQLMVLQYQLQSNFSFVTPPTPQPPPQTQFLDGPVLTKSMAALMKHTHLNHCYQFPWSKG